MRQPAVTVSFPQDCEPVTKSTSRVSTHLFATSSLRSHRHPSRKSGAVLQLRHLIAVQSPDHDNLPPPQPQLKLGTVTD
ncbi:Hypothetical protein, putative [Bodo saltans]|uniref:Uncharacterized protein n=1 Tax=Bodo saltans TaxID=75058 RepID=A0A0S4J559_BODSA|nr:Hypothetical protein, putative [Bodo saltans]|eukprot:CUG82510.1 Hypothetical protein, putative [Bodo saltans]